MGTVEQAEGGTPTREHGDDQSSVSGSKSDFVSPLCWPGRRPLYTQLCELSDGLVFDFFTRKGEKPVYGFTDLDEEATLAVFFLFEEDEDRQDCWHMLVQRMTVPVTAWLSRDDAGEGDPKGCTLVLLLHPDRLLLGNHTFEQIDVELERFLGCPGSRGDSGGGTWRRVRRISYEVVEERERVDWLCEREKLLSLCSKVEYRPMRAGFR